MSRHAARGRRAGHGRAGIGSGATAAGLLLAAGTALAGCAGETGNGLSATPAPVVARAPGPDFADVVARVAPAVVRVVTIERAQTGVSPEIPPELRGTPFEDFFRRFGRGTPIPERRRTGLGSGFIIDPAGDIVTNAHVVGGSSQVFVELTDGRRFAATVIGRDLATDVALIRVRAGAPLPSVALGDSDRVRVGEWIMAMGNPFGLGGSVTAGIVSARGRQIGAGPFDDFIQTDAPINPGSSGGPLFNQAGEVIGMSTAILTPSGGNIGIGFAVPSNIVRRVVAELRATGRVSRGWLGVTVQTLEPELALSMKLPAEATGAVVRSVEPGSPAAQAGLRPGDVIAAVNGRPVRSAHQVAAMVAETPPGSSAVLSIERAGARFERSIALGSRPDRLPEMPDRLS